MPDQQLRFLRRVETELFREVVPTAPVTGKNHYRMVAVSPGVRLGVDALIRTPRRVRAHLFTGGGSVPERWASFAGAGECVAIEGTIPRVALSSKGRVSLRYEWRQLTADYSGDFARALACARRLVEVEPPAGRVVRTLRTPPGTPPAIRLQDAAECLASAKVAIRSVLFAEGITRRHKRAVINRMLWAVTEEPWGKYTLPYRSSAALSERNFRNLRHEHVVTRRHLTDEIISHPDRIDEFVESAVACVVTKQEAALLDRRSGPAKGLEGWARYVAAGIEVVIVDHHGNASPYDLQTAPQGPGCP